MIYTDNQPSHGDTVTLVTRRGKKKQEQISKVTHILKTGDGFVCSLIPRGQTRAIKTARVAKRQEWAQARERSADERIKKSIKAMQDFRPGMDGPGMMQPVHPRERGRLARCVRRRDDHMLAHIADKAKAEDHRSTGENIEDQLAGAIYSNDPDAIEKLTAKATYLKAKHKAFKGNRDEDWRALRDEYYAGQTIEQVKEVCDYNRQHCFTMDYLRRDIRAAEKRAARLQRYLG
ncbi:MAG: hypothetical protein AAF442_00105 [Pseudomonadota bacterium]